MKETCGNCGHFVRHYLKHNGEYLDSGGHCKYPYEIFLAKGKGACSDYICRLPIDDEIIQGFPEDNEEIEKFVTDLKFLRRYE